MPLLTPPHALRILGGQAATTPAAPATPDRSARSALRVGWFRDRSRTLARAVGRAAPQEWILRRPTPTILDPRPCGRRQEARIGFAFAKARWNQACSGCFGVLQGDPGMVARVGRSQSARASQEGRPPASATGRRGSGARRCPHPVPSPSLGLRGPAAADASPSRRRPHPRINYERRTLSPARTVSKTSRTRCFELFGSWAT